MSPAEIAVVLLAGLAVGGLCLLSVVFVFYEFVDRGSLQAPAAASVIFVVIAVLLAGGSTGGLLLLAPIMRGTEGITYYLLSELGLFVGGLVAYLAARIMLGRSP